MVEDGEVVMKRSSPTTPDCAKVAQLWAELGDNPKTINRIASEIGCSGRVIAVVLERLNLRKRKLAGQVHNKWTTDKERRLAYLWNYDVPVARIGEMLGGHSYSSVCQRAKQLCLPSRRARKGSSRADAHL
jgi:hypothetical protein